MPAHATDTSAHISTDKILLDRQAKTDEPYKNRLSHAEFPIIAPAPTIKIPVPKKKDEAMDMPK